MYVKSLDLKNYRNYRELSLTPSPGINIFYGSNAQGKTNILESVYLAGTTKSHRGSKDRDIIKKGEDESHIRMLFMRRDNEYRIDVHLKRGRAKGIAVNGQPLKRAADLFGITSFVFFSPEDLGIIKNGPSARRRFLDLMLSAADRVYLTELSRYGKILSQRNALLHEAAFDRSRIPEIDVWDAELVRCGISLIEAREDFIGRFGKTAAEKHRVLTGGREDLLILYEKNASASDFADTVSRLRDTDLRTKMTNAGPHRDDLLISANGMDLRTFGSQGQQRTAALSMKLAEIEIQEKIRGDRPVLLLDDVLSELDDTRQSALLEGIRDTQTLITCTGLDDFVKKNVRADRIFHVADGEIKEQIQTYEQ